MRVDAGQWYDDNESRAMVSRQLFLARIQRGWKAQRALMEPLTPRPVPGARGRHVPRDILTEIMGGRGAKEHEAFGVTRPLTQWASETGVEVHNIRHGIDKHGSLERFLHYIGWYPGKARYVDDEVDLVVDLEARPWRPGDTIRRPAERKPPTQYRRINLDEDIL